MKTKVWLVARHEPSTNTPGAVSIAASAEYLPERAATEHLLVPEEELVTLRSEFARLLEKFGPQAVELALSSAYEALKIAGRRGEVK